MAKIAVEFERAIARRASAGAATIARQGVAMGEGWSVAEVLCGCGPQDRPFEEQHEMFSVAIILGGTFRYRSESRRGIVNELMTPGSLFLGNAGQSFECGHEHGAGDRCLAFQFEPQYFERLVADSGGTEATFPVLRLPSERQLSAVVTKACAALAAPRETSAALWEALGIQLVAEVTQLVRGWSDSDDVAASPSAVRAVATSVRWMEKNSVSSLTVGELARLAGLSPYHFLRTFQQVTGVTPHQYVRRMRLREAAIRLASEPEKVLDIALDCGFGDVSNFNRAFRAEFGVTPSNYRSQRSTAIRLPR